MIFFLVIALIIAALAVIFAFQNATPVTVTLLAWQLEGSLALLLLAAFLLGALAMLLVTLPALVKRSREIASQRKKIEKLGAGQADES